MLTLDTTEACPNHNPNAERQLWTSVIRQALEDATGGTEASSKPNERNRIKAEARAWFRTPSRDFNEACALAGLEPDRVRAFALDKIDEADKVDCGPRFTMITYMGRTMSISAWSQETGIGEGTLRFRLRKGLTTEEILTPPDEKRARKRRNNDKITEQAA